VVLFLVCALGVGIMLVGLLGLFIDLDSYCSEVRPFKRLAPVFVDV